MAVPALYNTDVHVDFGPVLAADGTMSSGALAYTDFIISKNGTYGALNAAMTATHKYEGHYDLLLKAADMSAVGVAEIVLNKNPLAAPTKEITVEPANVYNTRLGTDLLDVSLVQILGTALTETAGLIAAGFKKFFNIATPTGTVNSLPAAAANTDGGLPLVGVYGLYGRLYGAGNKVVLPNSVYGTVLQRRFLALSIGGGGWGGHGDDEQRLRVTSTGIEFYGETYDPPATYEKTWTFASMEDLDGVHDDLGVDGIDLAENYVAGQGTIPADSLDAFDWVDWLAESLYFYSTPNVTKVADIRTEMEKAGSSIAAVKTQTDKFNFTGTDVKATLDGEPVTLSNGAGADECTYTCKDSLGNKLENVQVWVSVNATGTPVYASGLTDSDGKVIFWLDEGNTYYIWRQKGGINFTNPQTWEVGITFTTTDGVAAVAVTYYCARADIESIFGIANVYQWADLENVGPVVGGGVENASIQLRIDTALMNASAHVDSILRGGHYVVPLEAVTAELDRVLVNIVATLAGVTLYEARGVQDFDPRTGAPTHRLSWARTLAESTLDKIASKQLTIDCVLKANSTPGSARYTQWER